MSVWQSFCGDLWLRRLDIDSSTGELAAASSPIIVRTRGHVLLAVTVPAAMAWPGGTVALRNVADELLEAMEQSEPDAAISVLRDAVWRRFEAGAFDRGVPEVMAVVANRSGKLRAWRAGPNGVAQLTPTGVALASEDLRFGALKRLGVSLEARWTSDPLRAEVSELTQLEPPHSAAQELQVDRGSGVLLCSRGALPFAAPSSGESPAAWCERDAGWRHGLGAMVLLIAEGGQRRLCDDYANALGAQVNARNQSQEHAVGPWLTELHRLAKQLVDGAESEREPVAARLARSGPAGWQVLATLAEDAKLPVNLRLVVANELSEAMPRQLLEFVALTLLRSEAPPLRGQGMVLCARLYLSALEPKVRASFSDPSSFQKGDICVSVAHLAVATVRALLSYRPAPSFPNWAEVATSAPDIALREPEESAESDELSEEYLALRQQLFQTELQDSGIWRLNFMRHAFGVVMETGYPLGTHTLAYLSDGKAHNHLSNGIVDTDAGAASAVRIAGEAFLAQAQFDWQLAKPTQHFPRPALGMVRFYFLGPFEIRVVEVEEQQLIDQVSQFSGLYHLGHGMLGEIHARELAAESHGVT